MTDDKLVQLYEKLYFEESEARDRIHSRLQLPLTLIIAIIGAIAFLLQSHDSAAPRSTAGVIFVFMLVVSGGFLLAAVYFFVRAHYNHEYLFLPDSMATAKYRLELEDTYKGYGNASALIAKAMEKYIVGCFIEYAAHNTRINDRRAAYIHKCTEAIIAAVLALAAAFAVFYMGDLDKNRIKSPTEVILKQPVDVRFGR